MTIVWRNEQTMNVRAGRFYIGKVANSAREIVILP